MALLSTRKSKLAAVGAAGVFGALAFGGIAYAVGGDEPTRSEYVTVVNDRSGSGSGTDDSGAAARDGDRDCPEKDGSRGGSPSETPSSPSSPSEAPSSPPSQEPAPGSAEDL